MDQFVSTHTGGLWKVDLSKTGTAALSRILTSTSGFNTDPTVVSSSVRSFGGGSGDQVVVIGSDFSVNPNTSGFSYVVDNGATVSNPLSLISAKQIQAFVETASTPGGQSTATDSQGNVYIFDNTNGIIYKYDDFGHFSKVLSRAEQI